MSTALVDKHRMSEGEGVVDGVTELVGEFESVMEGVLLGVREIDDVADTEGVMDDDKEVDGEGLGDALHL
jgi:hypothetical protein